ncbi:hypothetical protein C8Q79DRAFT_1118576 [Trametes meyenii]|nr:hypothetical protein C8Q79DRAFT_1118576 [Trametes meyenii]
MHAAVPIKCGSPKWVEQFVKPVVGPIGMKKGVGQLFSSASAFAMLTKILQLSYVRNSKTVKVSALRAWLMRGKITSKQIKTAVMHNTVGGMWSAVFEMLVDDMLNVVRAASWLLVDCKSVEAGDAPKRGTNEELMFNYAWMLQEGLGLGRRSNPSEARIATMQRCEWAKCAYGGEDQSPPSPFRLYTAHQGSFR